jgi:hypothetical protein
MRVRWNTNTDTPLPPEEPGGQNPPDGAIINYYLKEAATGPVTLEILDSKGKLVRRFASTDKPDPVDEKTLTIPSYWIRPPQILSAAAGSHRFVWDLHYPPPEGGRRGYPMTAVYHDTPSEPHGPWVQPGQYTARLTVAGTAYEQPLTVKMDPRVKTPADSLQQQFDLSMQCYDGMRQAREALAQIAGLRSQIKEVQAKNTDKELADSLTELDKKLAALGGTPAARTRGGERLADGPREQTIAAISQEMAQLLRILQGADATPTTTCTTACEQTGKVFRKLLARWGELKDKDVKALNERLSKAGLTPLAPKAEARKRDDD